MYYNSDPFKNPNHPKQEKEVPVYKNRSFLLFAGILFAIVLLMGYLTFFVEDLSKLFGGKKKVELVQDEVANLEKTAEMSDEEVKTSVIRFIEAFYRDQKKGYFDPPSYFAPITETYYNFHNLTYQRLREVHFNRLAEMRNLDQTWIVSSLDIDRDGDRIRASYWLRQSYFSPSKSAQESMDTKIELQIDGSGKIVSLKEVDMKNFTSYKVNTYVDSNVPYEEPVQQPAPVQEQPAPPANLPSEPSDTKLYDLGSVESAPEFPGGQRQLGRFLGSRIRYPSIARDNNVQGRVYISFVVEKSGELTDLKVVRGIGYGCDEEALRVMKLSPAWKPGTVQGKPVRTSYTLPITFQLAN